jgi:hypothetical protein
MEFQVSDSKFQASGYRFQLSDSRLDVCLLMLVTLLALAIRLPHWQTIPPAGDEVAQAVYALRITRGEHLPLVGNDAYAGPFFFYLLALLFRLGLADPLAGRTVVLVTGTLTVTLTYAWVRQLGGKRTGSVLAALLVAASPHLVLLNSHVGGTTFLLPFFTLLFLLVLTRAVNDDSIAWLVTAAIAGGLTIQSNPVGALVIASSWLWASWQARDLPRLGKRWPLWPLAGGMLAGLAYSPIIIYNLNSGLGSLSVAGQRSYLWEDSPTMQTFLVNAQRLTVQLACQSSGTLTGGETVQACLGAPVLYLAWALAGLAFVTRRFSRLPLATVLPFVVVLPIFSAHYGMLDPVRFTSLLTPVLAAGMGLLASGMIDPPTATRPRRQESPQRKREYKGQFQFPVSRFQALPLHAGWRLAAILAMAAAMMAYPLASLAQYYASAREGYDSGRVLLELSRQLVEDNRGEPVYISNSQIDAAAGILYVPQAHLIFANIYQEYLSPEQIVGRLFESPGAATMLLGEQDATKIQKAASLVRWPGAANDAARALGYGLYSLDTSQPLVKPTFVLTDANVHSVTPTTRLEIRLGNWLELIGYDVPQTGQPGEVVKVTLYWRAAAPAQDETYIGFVHLYRPSTPDILAQDDHELGRQRYPPAAWQPDEIVIERYALKVPEDAASSQYALRSGVYTWPELTRLDVPGQPDDIVELGLVDVY